MQLRILFVLLLAITATAQDLPASETITRQAPDDVALVADFYAAPEETTDAPVIIALHMLNSNRSAYEPIIPDLHDAGYAILKLICAGTANRAGRAIGTRHRRCRRLDRLAQYRRPTQRKRFGDHGREHRRQCRHHQLRRT